EAAARPVGVRAQRTAAARCQARIRQRAAAPVPTELRSLLQAPLRALDRSQLQRGERALPGIAALGRAAAQRERADLAARLALQLQVLDRAVRIEGQGFDRRTDVEPA